MNTIEGNKLIAEFMGWEFVEWSTDRYWKGYYGGVQQWDISTIEFKSLLSGENGFSFHCNWNKLMPVVEKIEELVINEIGFDVDIHYTVCNITGGANDPPYITVVEKNKIKAVFKACVQFIQWLNNEKAKH